MSEPAQQDMARRAVPVDTRLGWMLVAVLPGALLRVQGSGLGELDTLLKTVLIAAACEIGTGVARRVGVTRSTYRESVLLGLLTVLWLPHPLPAWATGIGTVAAIVSRRMAFGGGPSPFHPAMTGGALAMLAIAAANLPVASDPAALPTALAFALGGLALAAGRCIRWQVPLAFLLPVGLVLAFQALGPGPPALAAWTRFLPALVLAAFFVATDPASGCAWPRARWWFGALAGGLSMAAVLTLHDHAVYLGLAGAVLFANAAAPWLDRAVGRAHGARRVKAPGA